MAKQDGIIKIKGTVGDFTFYQSQDGMMVRKKGGIDRSRIANDPSFIRTRENNAEFSESGTAGKTLRNAIRPYIMTSGDNRSFSRLVKVMSDIKNLDSVSARGKRNVATGISNTQAKALLKGFNFNINAVIGAILKKPYVLTPSTGEVSIANLMPVNDIVFPEGATHVSFKSLWANVDFATGESEVQESNEVTLALDSKTNSVLLTPTQPHANGTEFFLLNIVFFQEINGVKYALKNGSYNCLAIIEVA
jgi:hypothetical protein